MLTEYIVETKSEGRYTVWAEDIEVIPEGICVAYSHMSFIEGDDVVAGVRLDDVIRVIEVESD